MTCILRALLAALCLLVPGSAFGQGTVLQGGPWAPGRVPMYVGQSSLQAVIMDGGSAAGGAVGTNISEIGITARGVGTPPYVGQGSGPFGTNFCDYDAPITNPTGYHYFCLSANAQGGGLLAYGAGGAASQLPLQFSVNGVTYQFPFSLNGILGPPTSAIGDIAVWANTAGTLLSDTGIPVSSLAPKDSPAFTGTPTAPTPAPGDNSTRIATTAFMQSALIPYAPLASPAFTGTPTAPTAAIGTSTTQLATTQFVQSAASAVVPQRFGAVCDGGATDSTAALQAWANSLRDGGTGAWNCAAGYGISGTILFQPTSHDIIVEGPSILDTGVLIGIGSSLVTPAVEIWNANASGSVGSFYYARFGNLSISNTTGPAAHAVSLRGFWGTIGDVTGDTIGGDVVNFPSASFGGSGDPYESIPTLGDVTGVDVAGLVLGNDIGIAASPTFGNLRGLSRPGFTAGGGAFLGGDETGQGVIYSGNGWALTIGQPTAAPVQASPHEIQISGTGDIDCAENGIQIQALQEGKLWGHRINVEPPGTCNAASWPRTAYSFQPTAGVAVTNVVVDAYVVIRAGVTAANIGTLFDFNNSANIANLTLNATLIDSTGTGLLATLGFAGIYKNINPNSNIKIVQNGVVVYNSIQQNSAMVRGAASSIAINSSGTITKLAGTWTVLTDTNAMWSAASNQINIKTPGLYQVGGTFSVPVGAGAGQVAVGTLVNIQLIYSDGVNEEVALEDQKVAVANTSVVAMSVSMLHAAGRGGSFYIKGSASAVSSGTLYAKGFNGPPATLQAALQTAGQ